MLSSATYYQSKFDTEEEVDEIWTKPAAFSLMEEGQQVFSQNVDIRIAGSFGRGRAFIKAGIYFPSSVNKKQAKYDSLRPDPGVKP